MMQPFTLLESIQQTFEQHQIPYLMEGEWLIPYGDFVTYPAIRLLWFPYEINGCLQVEVFHHDQTLMIECFAGLGKGDAAILDGLQNFLASAFHVLAVAFWKLSPDDHVTIEEWKIADSRYKAYIARVCTREINMKMQPAFPHNWFECFSTQIQRKSCLNHVAWFRLFVGKHRQHLTVEVLRNNETWEEAQDILSRLNWTTCQGYYSIRQFVVLKVM